MDIFQESLNFHRKHKGKIALAPKISVRTREELSLAYSPGVAEASREIARNPEAIWDVTSRSQWVAVITDGSAVLGLGDVGPAASLPVMEGKCVLFKEFAGIDAFPIALKTRNIDDFVSTVKEISLSFGAINLEDIGAPRCFEIEERLKTELSIPVMHDDQHGTAVVAVAGLINALRVTERTFDRTSFVISGAGAAGVAIAKLLYDFGVRDMVVVDSKGILSPQRTDLDEHKKKLLTITNPTGLSGGLADAVIGRDVFIGVSAPGILTGSMVERMAPQSIVFALANPTPEIMPDVAKASGALIVATGRSDFPNQVNNVLAYPGIFKGVLSVRAPQITELMKRRAAETLASCVLNPSPDEVIPDVFNKSVVDKISSAVANAV